MLSKILSWLSSILGTGKAGRVLSWLRDKAPEIVPIIDVVASITPTPIDDAALAWFKDNFGVLLDGQVTDDDVRTTMTNLLKLGVATKLLQQRDGTLSTTEARTIIQLGYLQQKG